ncbi:MAG: 50S ribosomal protein L25 [Candidatus Magasanikbacteria bacterium CG_4_9_14_0_2_um_filter_42_11]|uniref:Large ribosomal subunit protein bL25 n=1 Tax=Candidatus Magasanikbacteria bacterium CG_4_9_14_0_2_um_filter_42_11 TaxID=1974643 RepID=A0A2M8FB67_9BACT|nr:MAG: 50S ribosomal protein L25 [Candidatus Magasanikbacteria bacterium CG10_big_fil_rev_8_21_14_0_10_43_9]PIY92086.1 MAG: 50S ribosomal protein L25 [Candidatus Magasanikbacteria bacterium CG_4_10_14_0_8_um_filter_42_12]PJC52948.1 MAG: 50S ribosomal protein L25 [Candidatus Magasanikbacteria bacterium CG_4_9_14_0_2_um_filter_42_11]
MTFQLTVQKRDAGHAEDVRDAGRIPAIVYGAGMEPVPVSVDAHVFDKLYADAGESSLIDFTIDGGSPTKVLVQDVQYDSIKDRFIHIDFRQINMNVEMQATIELHFVGASAAVKALGGTLIEQRDTVDVTCLPKDLVNHIDVDISVLATFDDAIHIKDLAVPAGITIDEDADELVAKVSAPLSEDQLNAMETSQVGDVATVEVDEKKKEEAAAAEKEAEKK